jgi:hypothetical protein
LVWQASFLVTAEIVIDCVAGLLPVIDEIDRGLR